METFLMVITLLTAQDQYFTASYMGEWETEDRCMAAVFEVGDTLIKDPTTPWNRSITNCIPLDDIGTFHQPPNT